ncbi:MAG: hypothetical protein MUE54_01825 [Anaerolineae bacterium]|jgi:hypothetical protein|nr:hypothetical protein [Anaerolineae bacterium]
MKFRNSLFFLIVGFVLIGAGLLTQVMGVAHASPPKVQQQPTPVVPPFTDIACLECHTNQEALQTLAVEKEVVDSHSEGPG